MFSVLVNISTFLYTHVSFPRICCFDLSTLLVFLHQQYIKVIFLAYLNFKQLEEKKC